MPANFRSVARVFLRGVAQVVFADSAASGVAVLAGLALMSPWLALGAAAGAAMGTGTGRFFGFFPASQWRAGLTGYNTAIIGIIGAGLLAQGGAAQGGAGARNF